MKGINPQNLAQFKKAQRQFDKEEEEENKKRDHNLLADETS
jgi:hypothetical protein